MINETTLKWAFFIVCGFLLGGVMFCRIVPKAIFKKDICALSPDRNPGAANVFLVCGWEAGMLCLALDMLKGFLPVFLTYKALGCKSFAFSAVMLAPVLGHALAPLSRKSGGKCISASFGVSIAMLPVTLSGLALALLYIFFSTVWKINPVRVRSITTFSVFGLLAFLSCAYEGLYAVGMGYVMISLTAVTKHLKLFSFVPEEHPQAAPANEGKAE